MATELRTVDCDECGGIGWTLDGKGPCQSCANRTDDDDPESRTQSTTLRLRRPLYLALRYIASRRKMSINKLAIALIRSGLRDQIEQPTDAMAEN